MSKPGHLWLAEHGLLRLPTQVSQSPGHEVWPPEVGRVLQLLVDCLLYYFCPPAAVVTTPSTIVFHFSILTGVTCSGTFLRVIWVNTQGPGPQLRPPNYDLDTKSVCGSQVTNARRDRFFYHFRQNGSSLLQCDVKLTVIYRRPCEDTGLSPLREWARKPHHKTIS